MESSAESQIWRKCSSCKKSIAFGSPYYICSVSTCNGQRTGYTFCSVGCFETHLPAARHREAGAIEKKAPTSNASASAPTPNRTLIRPAGVSSTPVSSTPRDVLIIASRLKEYIDAKAGYNTSANVLEVLSDYVRILCDRAIDNAREEGRKTVMDRDFQFFNKQ